MKAVEPNDGFGHFAAALFVLLTVSTGIDGPFAVSFMVLQKYLE